MTADANLLHSLSLIARGLPDAVVSLDDGRIEVLADGVRALWHPGAGLPVVLTGGSGRVLDVVALAADEVTQVLEVILAHQAWSRRQRDEGGRRARP